MSKRLFLSLLATFAFQFLFAQKWALSNFPKGPMPEEVGMPDLLRLLPKDHQDCPRNAGGLHGQAPYLWRAAALSGK